MPVFVDGQAQVVDAFSDSSRWVRDVLWVETEFDSDGDEFMVKVDIKKVYKGNGIDDTGWDGDEDDNTKYCIIQLK